MKIGVLAIQGDYEAHGRMLERLGVEPVYVRTPADLAGLRGLIIPGGESTTHMKILTEEGLLEALRKYSAEGGAFFGTCAGAILLAREVHNPDQASLGFLDISVLRNGYGRQLSSDVHLGASKLKDEPLEMVFIRAPIIESVGPGVKILAEDAAFSRRHFIPSLPAIRQSTNISSKWPATATNDPAKYSIKTHESLIRMRR
jgi:5'-phosphate synthase pdxT subunit